MTKHLLIMFSLILVCSAEQINLNDATKIGSNYYDPSNVIHCGDYDGDGSEDICLVFENFSTNNTVFIDSLKIYSYKKKKELLNVAVYKTYYSQQLITNVISSRDLDEDGDTEIIVRGYLFDYLSDGVVKK